MSCTYCRDTGDCRRCDGLGSILRTCSECGGMRTFAGHDCETCHGEGTESFPCPACGGDGVCPHCEPAELRCPVCNAGVKWTCQEDTGIAHCQDGRRVSRRLPGEGEPCLWPGGRIVRAGRRRVVPDHNDPNWFG